jgi:hypothetical protein
MPPTWVKRARLVTLAASGRQSKRQRQAASTSSGVPGAGGQPADAQPGQQPDHGVQDPQHPNAPGNNRAVLTCHSWASVYSLLTPTINPTACCPQAPMSSSMMQTWPTTASMKHSSPPSTIYMRLPRIALPYICACRCNTAPTTRYKLPAQR